MHVRYLASSDVDFCENPPFQTTPSSLLLMHPYHDLTPPLPLLPSGPADGGTLHPQVAEDAGPLQGAGPGPNMQVRGAGRCEIVERPLG